MTPHDMSGAIWEKHGNTTWLACPRCRCAFPVSPRMQAPEAPACCCPGCHLEFSPARGPRGPTAP